MVRMTQAIMKTFLCALVWVALLCASSSSAQLPTCTISGGPFYSSNGTFNSNLAFHYTVFSGIVNGAFIAGQADILVAPRADNGTSAFTAATAGTDYTTSSSTEIFTNKRITPRVTSITSNATWSPSADNDDVYVITAQAVAVTTISNPSGTPVNGQRLMIRVKDDGTARALTWSGSQWRASTDLALPATTTLSKTMYLLFVWNATDSKWDFISKLDNF